MRRISFFVLGLVFIAAPALGQSASSDSQTLQAILQEIRQLRQDLHAATAASEHARILFYQMQVQQAAVGRAQQRLDEARSALAQAQKQRKALENQLKYYTDQDTEERTPDSAARKRLEDSIPRFKASYEEAAGEEQQAQSKEMEAKDQLQIEQAKLDGLQNELDRLDKSLENLARQPG